MEQLLQKIWLKPSLYVFKSERSYGHNLLLDYFACTALFVVTMFIGATFKKLKFVK